MPFFPRVGFRKGLAAQVTAPTRSVRAWQQGRGQHNLYRLDPDELLGMDLDDVRRFVAS